VLHRLSEAEIDSKREGGDELRQANATTIGVNGHASEPNPLGRYSPGHRGAAEARL